MIAFANTVETSSRVTSKVFLVAYKRLLLNRDELIAEMDSLFSLERS